MLISIRNVKFCMKMRCNTMFITAVCVSSYDGPKKNKSLFDNEILTEDPNEALRWFEIVLWRAQTGY